MRTFRSPELDELVNQIGNFIQHWGFKNVQGRMWAHLFVSEEALDAAALMKRLDISKALVSISLKELLAYRVIHEVGKSERGTTLYRANPDTAQVIMNVLRSRERMMLSRISSAFRLCEGLGEREKEKLRISDKNLQKLKQLIQGSELCLDAILHSELPKEEFWTRLLEAFQSIQKS